MTAAHSTLELGDESSARLAHEIGLGEWAGGRIFIGPRVTGASRRDGPDACVLEARHDGYASRFGLAHARTLTLATDGGRLEGVDLLEPVAGRKPREGLAYAIRFHLHPTVKAARVERENGVMLVLPNGRPWLFHASGRQVELEDGAFFASADGSRAAQQIVIRGLALEEPETRWVFLRGS